METIANYTLRNKDIPLIRFSLLRELQRGLDAEQYAYTVHIDSVDTEHSYLLPQALRYDLNDKKLLRWINHRKAPKNRQFVQQIMSSIEDDANPLKYVDISHALSLNDAYWITNDAANSKWDEYNLYDHPFDEILAHVAFTGYSKRVSGVVTSPELTSSGMLKKCWTKRPEGIFLMKGDDFIPRPDGRSQATMEFYAAQVADKMGFEHIHYDLEKFHHRNGTEEMVCLCPLFTSADIGFVPAYEFFNDQGIEITAENISELATQTKMAYAYGLNAYQDLMVFDSVICNQDRHLGNFGYLVDNNTGKYLRPAPIFDNGLSLLAGAAQGNLERLEEYIHSIQGKYMTFDRQAQLFVQPRHAPLLRSLLNFHLDKHPRFNVSDEAIDKMSKMIQIRAKRILAIYQEKKQKLERTNEKSR